MLDCRSRNSVAGLAVAVMALGFWPGHAAAQQLAQTPSVLMLFSLRSTAPSLASTEVAFRRTLEASLGAAVEFHLEYLDLPDGENAHYGQLLRDLLADEVHQGPVRRHRAARDRSAAVRPALPGSPLSRCPGGIQPPLARPTPATAVAQGRDRVRGRHRRPTYWPGGCGPAAGHQAGGDRRRQLTVRPPERGVRQVPGAEGAHAAARGAVARRASRSTNNCAGWPRCRSTASCSSSATAATHQGDRRWDARCCAQSPEQRTRRRSRPSIRSWATESSAGTSSATTSSPSGRRRWRLAS